MGISPMPTEHDAGRAQVSWGRSRHWNANARVISTDSVRDLTKCHQQGLKHGTRADDMAVMAAMTVTFGWLAGQKLDLCGTLAYSAGCDGRRQGQWRGRRVSNKDKDDNR